MNRRRALWLAVGGVLLLGVLLVQTGLLPVSAAFADERELRVTDCAGSEKGRLTVSVAETWSQQYVGLSRTESLVSDEGMLFVYGENGSKGIAMRNMDFPLDVIFVSPEGNITKIETLDAPDSLLSYYLLYDSTSGPGRFVVETNAGWSEANGVSVGDCVRGLSE